MDAKVSNEFIGADELMVGIDHTNDDFLLREGLEVLATYRSIRNDAVRLAVKEMIAVISKATDDLN